MNIGIIGGTGPAGIALGRRLASVGHQVVIGSRELTRASEIVAAQLIESSTCSLNLVPGTNEQAAACDLCVLATPWEGAVATARSLQASLEQKVLISMVNALARVGSEFQALVPARGSIAASVQAVLPRTFVTTAFQHIPARELGLVELPIEAEVMVCSDSEEGAVATELLVGSIHGLRPVRCGSLASANAVEALTAVLLNVNIAYKSHVSLRLTGLRESGSNPL